jgi:hypothetical protein
VSKCTLLARDGSYVRTSTCPVCGSLAVVSACSCPRD